MELYVATGVGGRGIGAGGIVAVGNASEGLELMTNWVVLSVKVAFVSSCFHSMSLTQVT